MGSCYSCRSNGGPPTYTTVAMASTIPESLPHRGGGGGNGSGSSLLRGGGGGSFGFRKRTPVLVKSQFKDRTGELVHLYETKISNLCNTNNNSRLVSTSVSASSSSPITTASNNSSSANIPKEGTRFGFQPAPRMSQLNNKNYGGGVGGNSITTTINNNYNNNVVFSGNGGVINNNNGLRNLSERERFFMCGPLTVPKTDDCDYFVREQQKKQTTTITTAGAAVDDVRNGNLVSNDTNNYSNNKLPCMVKTQLSGLPRPQLPVLLDKKSSESMRVSPNEDEEMMMMMMLEADSGLGNSLSEKKNGEGDTETLAEVDQIEGDNLSIRSKRESPGKTTMTDEENNKLLHVVVVDNNNQIKVPKASGIARFKYSNPVKNTTVSQLQATKVNLGGGIGEKKVPEKTKEAHVVQNQARIPRKIPLAVQLSNRTGPGAIPGPVTGLLAAKAGPKKSMEGLTKRGLYYTSPSKVGGGLMKKDELRQKENITPEVVEVVPINLNLVGSKVSESGSKVIGSNYNKSARIESVLPSSLVSEPAVVGGGGGSFSGVRTGGGSGRWSGQAKDTPDSSLNDSGPYSPPSEKDFFLIDDEIADQPALINCQQLNGKDLRSYSRSRLTSVHVLTDMNEEGGVPAMAHLQSCLSRSPLTRRRLSHSIDTLSPCSSLASDDLMMDFDRLDETLQSRPLSDVFGDGFQLIPGEGKAAEHFLLSKLNSGTGKTPGDADHLTRRSASSQKTSWILGGGGSGSPSPANVPGRSVGSLSAPSVGGRRASEEIEASVDLATYRLLTQDITNVKTLLLRLKRLLQEADHEQHPLAPHKNGLIVHSNAVVEESKTNTALEQENADLRRQVVFLQQQLEEKERSIRLLQQQQARNNVSEAESRAEVSLCNAACQTERQRSTLNSFLTSSANNDDSLYGSTVSFNRSASSSVAARVLDKA